MNFKLLFHTNREAQAAERQLRQTLEQKRAKELVLSELEKEQGRAALQAMMGSVSPVREEGGLRHQLQRSSSVSFIRYIFKPMTAAIIVVLTVAIGGGASFAAEQSLPGDPLYPVKVHVNEEVRSAVSFSAEAKADWEARRVERRLEEANQLTVRGRMDTNVASQLESRVNSHAERTETFAVRLEEETKTQIAADVYARLETSLHTHAAILSRVASDAQVDERLVQGIVTASTVRAQSATDARTRVESRITAGAQADVQAAAENRRRATQQKIAEVEVYLERVRARAGAEATAEAEARLEAAQELYAEGEAHAQGGAYADAFAAFQQAHRAAQEARLLVKTSSNLRIDMGIGPIQIHRGPDREPREERDPEAPSEEEEQDQRPGIEVEVETEAEAEAEAETEAEAEANGGIRIEQEGSLEVNVP